MSYSAAGSRNIDDLLCGLKAATRTLNSSLKVLMQPERRAIALSPLRSKEEVVCMLMKEVEQRYGIAAGEQVERKLLRIFDVMSFDDLECWCRSLLSLHAAEAEWLSLVECLTVHETYFDRDREQLGTLSAEILPGLIEQKRLAGDYRLRIWSAGCSSGEETYNLAMLTLLALREAGCACGHDDGSITPLPEWKISVLGSDISSQMIRVARDVTYTTGEMGSFRDMNPQLWRFFDEREAGHDSAATGRIMRVKPCVADITTFRRHNLLEPLLDVDRFDLILCRNVLIYMNSDNKRAVQERLCRHLSAEGMLILGATDTLLCRANLERRQHNGYFWYVNDQGKGQA